VYKIQIKKIMQTKQANFNSRWY